MKNFLQNKIYPVLPLFIQNIAISIFGFFWQKRRFGGIFKSELIRFKEREFFSEKDWTAHQTNELRKMLIESYKNVPFYTYKFSELGLTIKDFETFELKDLKKLPFLEKDELRKFGENSLLSSKIDKNGSFYATSGSTGTPAKIYISKLTHQRWSAAFETRIRNWAGINYKTPRGMIGGRRVLPNANDGPPFYRFNIAEKQVYFSAYHISAANTSDYVNGMIKHKTEYMNGYAVSNYLLAKFIKQENIKAPKLKAVITSSEKLTDEMRQLLQEVYQCKVFDSWSGVEACALVSECEQGSLHISEDVGLIEILDKNGNEVGEGESGEVVCTSFINIDQPLIRYRIGDRMTKGIGLCKCGRNLPVIKEIEGRFEDVIVGKDGREMVRFHGIFVGINSIERAQVIQHTFDDIEIKIQNEIALTNTEILLIKERVESQLGSVNVIVNQQQKIQQTANGKYKAVISMIKN